MCLVNVFLNLCWMCGFNLTHYCSGDHYEAQWCVFNIEVKPSRSLGNKVGAMGCRSRTQTSFSSPLPLSGSTCSWLAIIWDKDVPFFIFRGELRESGQMTLNGIWEEKGRLVLFCFSASLFSGFLKFVTFVIFLFTKWQFPGDFSLHIISWPFSERLFLISLPACCVTLFHLQVFRVNTFLNELSVPQAVFYTGANSHLKRETYSQCKMK